MTNYVIGAKADITNAYADLDEPYEFNSYAYTDTLDSAGLLNNPLFDADGSYMYYAGAWDMIALREYINNNSDYVYTINYYGETPLFIAARHNREDNVLLLISKGADVNAMNFFGHNAFTNACFNKHYAIAKLLYDHSASIRTNWFPNFLIDINEDIKKLSADDSSAFFFICKLLYAGTYLSIMPSDVLTCIIIRCHN